MKTATNDFSQLLRRFRLNAELSQIALAKQAGITQSTYNRFERGKRLPSRNHIQPLSEALKLDPFDRASLFNAAGYSATTGNFFSPLGQDTPKGRKKSKAGEADENKDSKASKRGGKIIAMDLSNPTLQEVAALLFDPGLRGKRRDIEEQLRSFVGWLRQQNEKKRK